eukprot:130557-Prorocentrum_minimum.AAC.2
MSHAHTQQRAGLYRELGASRRLGTIPNRRFGGARSPSRQAPPLGAVALWSLTFVAAGRPFSTSAAITPEATAADAPRALLGAARRLAGQPEARRTDGLVVRPPGEARGEAEAAGGGQRSPPAPPEVRVAHEIREEVPVRAVCLLLLREGQGPGVGHDDEQEVEHQKVGEQHAGVEVQRDVESFHARQLERVPEVQQPHEGHVVREDDQSADDVQRRRHRAEVLEVVAEHGAAERGVGDQKPA